MDSWTGPRTQSVPALERGLLMLEYLAQSRRGVTLSQLARKLNLPRSRLGRGDEARAGNGKPGLIEDRQVLRRRSKVGAVQNVKKFGAELSIEALRNALHGIVFENREIQV